MTGRDTAGRKGKGDDGRARTREVKLGVSSPRTNWTMTGPRPRSASTSVIAIFEPAPVFAGLLKAEASAAARTTSASSPSSATEPHGSGNRYP